MYWILFVTFVSFGNNTVSNPIQSSYLMFDEASCVYDVRFPVGSKVGRGLLEEFELRSIK